MGGGGREDRRSKISYVSRTRETREKREGERGGMGGFRASLTPKEARRAAYTIQIPQDDSSYPDDQYEGARQQSHIGFVFHPKGSKCC